MERDTLLNEMTQSIIDGNRDQAKSLAREAISQGMDLNAVIEQGFVPGIQKVGDLWEQGEYFLPELITSAECMKAVMKILQPELDKANIRARSLGKIVIGTIEGDIHDIGKNLVASMLGANGFDVVDLGADVKLDRFIATAQEVEADLICVSALLTTTMLLQKTLVVNLREQGLLDRFKVMVGGAPVNQRWAQDIGAHGYAENAMTAVQAVKELLGSR
ncbi:MAG: corrinoid protein [Candidatus Aminicenantaceae bacterium]